MKNKIGLIWLCTGLAPYIFTLIYSIYAIYNGISNCIIDYKEFGCDTYYGITGFAETWYIALYVLFPIFLVFLFFIILGFTKTRHTDITRSRLLLIFGVSPFLLAMFLLIFACLANPSISISYLFADIFMKHFFVVISEFIGIVLILISLKKLKDAEEKQESKKKNA